jgi:hypothetical protein
VFRWQLRSEFVPFLPQNALPVDDAFSLGGDAEILLSITAFSSLFVEEIAK